MCVLSGLDQFCSGVGGGLELGHRLRPQRLLVRFSSWFLEADISYTSPFICRAQYSRDVVAQGKARELVCGGVRSPCLAPPGSSVPHLRRHRRALYMPGYAFGDVHACVRGPSRSEKG